MSDFDFLSSETYTPPTGDSVNFTFDVIDGAVSGRKMYVLDDTDSIVMGLKTTSANFGAAPIDITSDDDDGYRKIQTDTGEWSLDVGIEGVTKDTKLINQISSGTDISLANYTLELATSEQYRGDYKLIDLTITGAYSDAVKFSGNLVLSGEFS